MEKHTSIALVDKEQLAAHLGVGVWTIGEWIRQGKLPRPTVKLTGKVHRWRVSDIEAWLAKMSKATYVPPALRGKAHADALAKVAEEEDRPSPKRVRVEG